MSLIRIVLVATLGLWLVGPGMAQSPTGSPSGVRPDGLTQPRAGDTANRGGCSKQQRLPRREREEPQSSDSPTDPEDARLTRILNGICRGC